MLTPLDVDNPVNVKGPSTVRLPTIPVEPVIDILLPDIFVSRYIKLPSPSGYVSGLFAIVIPLPGLGSEVIRNIKPIVYNAFTYKYTKRMAPQMRSHRFLVGRSYFIVERVVYLPAIGLRRALLLHIRGNIFVLHEHFLQ